jgi:hypothetical protein
MAQGGEWSRLNNQGQTFLRVYTFSPGCTLISVGGMTQGGEWSKLNIPYGYTFSPGCTLISVGRIAQGEEWSRFRRHDSYYSLLEKNSPYISLLYSEGDILSELTDVSEGLAQMIQFIS